MELGSSPLTMRKGVFKMENKEKKVMTKTVEARKSERTGNLYLVEVRNGKTTFINLIKDSKAYKPKLREGNIYEIDFTSYQFSEDSKAVTLFNVSGI